MPGDLDADALAEELNDCRQRGLDWLDRSTTNQRPLLLPLLERLAEEYAVAKPIADVGRRVQIKTLLRDGIAELARQGHASDADLLRDLFFGQSLDGAISPPGVLLKKAQGRFGDETPSRFRERRVNVMRSFARFLIGFVFPPALVSAGAEDQWQRLATVGYVTSNDHFIQLLASAVNVTIVGITNERLPEMLEQALRLKREAGRPDAFWQSLRIAFLSRALLDVVNDEWEALDPGRALGQRRHEAVWARRSVWDLLKRANATRWLLYECPYLPTLNGALLEFEDGRKIVRLLIRRARRSRPEHVYVELDDVGDRFAAIFEDVIHECVSAELVVPVGFPADSTFHYRGPRNQTKVLVDGSGADGWLPMVLIVTPRRTGDQVLAMLQLRTQANSARELRRVSHLSGYVLQDDRLRPSGHMLPVPPQSFGLTDETPFSAASRVVQEVSADELSAAIRPVATGRYLYTDKEHLFFFIYVLDLPEGIQFPRRAEMHPFRLSELMGIRANQILRSAAALCRSAASGSGWSVAAEVLSLNLCLHDQPELGARLMRMPEGEREEFAHKIDQLVTTRTCPSLLEPGRDIEIAGLAGWQHREFFSVLVRLYADIGITGARELVREIDQDDEKSAAVRRLSELYADEDSMASVPMEL